jgi:hypothetical protein
MGFFTIFTNEATGHAVSSEQAKTIAEANRAKGLTDDGSSPIAVRLDTPVRYHDPGLDATHGGYLATNTLQQARYVSAGFLTDVAEVQRRRAAEILAKDQEF